MSDFNEPTNTSLYSGIWATVRAMFAALAKMDFTGISNVPTNAIRHDGSSTNKFQKWNGSTYADLTVHFGNPVGIGTSSPATNRLLDVRGPLILGNGSTESVCEFREHGSTNTAWVTSVRSDVGGSNLDLKFLRYDSNTFQDIPMQIVQSNGAVLFGKSTTSDSTAGLQIDGGTAWRAIKMAKTTSGSQNGILFYHNGAYVGGVNFSDSATAFPTSSDYRLKENLEPLSGVRERFRRLRVYRGNFKADPGTMLDMFLAHEVQEIVPNAVFGEKDGEEMQALDHSKLVPLLTAMLLEEQDRNDALEARLAALEAKVGA